MPTLKIKDIKPEYAAKEVRDASGNVLPWDQVLLHYPNYEIQVKDEKPLEWENTPAQDYRFLENIVKNDPNGPYAATKWLLGQQVALPLGALGVVTAPAAITVGGIAGGVLGDVGGHYLSNYLYDNPDKPIKLFNTNLEFTPRTATSLGGSFIGGIAGGYGGYAAANTGRNYLISRELNRAVKKFDGTVGDRFSIPDKRIVVNESSAKPVFGNKHIFNTRSSKLTEAERLGIPKGDRGNLTEAQKQAIEDLEQYVNSGQFRQTFNYDEGWTTKDKLSIQEQARQEGIKQRGPFIKVQNEEGTGIIAYSPSKNAAVYTSRMFQKPEGWGWAPGEANMLIDGTNGHKIILTAPKVDAQGIVITNDVAKLSLDQLPMTIDPKIVKDFWINVRRVQRPGTYLSGDNAELPLGNNLIEAFKNKKLHNVYFMENGKVGSVRRGLSPDSYSSIIRQGNRDGSLRWGEGFDEWTNSAVKNRHIYDAWKKLKDGTITNSEYEKIFNDWAYSIGGKPLKWIDNNGEMIPIHPHPYIYAKKSGGSLIPKHQIGTVVWDKYYRFCGPMYHALYKAFKNVGKVSENQAMQLARYATYQMANESGYGTSRLAREQHNYGGMKNGNKGWQKFNSMEDFANQFVRNQMKNFKETLSAQNYDDYIDGLFDYQYQYAPDEGKELYNSNLQGVQSRVDSNIDKYINGMSRFYKSDMDLNSDNLIFKTRSTIYDKPM